MPYPSMNTRKRRFAHKREVERDPVQMSIARLNTKLRKAMGDAAYNKYYNAYALQDGFTMTGLLNHLEAKETELEWNKNEQ